VNFLIIALGIFLALPVFAAEMPFPDLPPTAQVETALRQHIDVLTAESGISVEQANQRKWNSGSYEFNVRAGSSQRKVTSTGQQLREWDVAIERPFA